MALQFIPMILSALGKAGAAATAAAPKVLGAAKTLGSGAWNAAGAIGSKINNVAGAINDNPIGNALITRLGNAGGSGNYSAPAPSSSPTPSSGTDFAGPYGDNTLNAILESLKNRPGMTSLPQPTNFMKL